MAYVILEQYQHELESKNKKKGVGLHYPTNWLISPMFQKLPEIVGNAIHLILEYLFRVF